MSQQKHIAIVGGGIAGLAAAYYLQKEINEQQLPYNIKLIEASDRLGGKIQTVKQDGYMIERGPDSFLIRKESATTLAKEVGLEQDLVKNGTGQSYILVNNKLHKMPSGSFMGIPTQIRPFLFSGLFSPIGKVRAAGDLIRSKGRQESDQSLGKFFRRRFGNELVDNLVEPLLSGIYAGDIDDLSLMATFPNFYYLEQDYGSLIKGLHATVPKQKSTKGKKPSMFYSLKNGLQSLVDAIEDKLEKDTIVTGVSVDHIEKKENLYHLLLGDGQVHQADAVVLATPFFSVQRMLSQFDFVNKFNEMSATSVANVALAFDASAIEKDIDGTGFVVSRNSDYRITACTWTHKKWPETTTPDGKVLLRCFVGKPGDEAVVDLSDAEIVAIAMKDLNKIMNISQQPELSLVTRWKNAMPQYSVGHKDRLKYVKEKMRQELPGVYLAGGSYRGTGLPDCISQGQRAVDNVLVHLKSQK